MISFAAFVAGSLRTERFSLLDVGCSGGLDPAWRAFGTRLRALGIDASETECRRLAAEEKNPDVTYVASFVAPRPGQAIDLSAGPAAPHIMRMRDRLSFMRTREIREERLRHASSTEQFRHNAWELTGLADPSKPMTVEQLLTAHGWTDLDCFKIDTDGIDWDVLQPLDGKLAPLGLLALQMEVNFIGDGSAEEHSFHNTDRFLRRQGFDLFRLDVRTYSSRALPARYVWPTPAETLSGRPFQGEAYYALDVVRLAGTPAADSLSPEKLAKLAAILSLWKVPDAAAEILQHHRSRLQGLMDVDRGLDLLARQTQEGSARALPYKAYMARFESDPPDLYRREGAIGLGERLSAAWKAFRAPRP